MGDFEWALVNSLNSFFEKDGIAAIAYRLKQSRFSAQFMDILVDSKIPEYYLAIECKSLDARKTKSLYFKQHFSLAAGSHQMTRETEFITRSGRQGILAVELRYGAGKARTRSPRPLGSDLPEIQRWRDGHLLAGDRDQPTSGEKGRSAYRISRLDIVRISGYFDLAGEGDGQVEDPASEE